MGHYLMDLKNGKIIKRELANPISLNDFPSDDRTNNPQFVAQHEEYF